MRRILSILVILLCGCTHEYPEHELPDKDGNVNVRFTIQLPEAVPAGTRAINENLLTGLQVLVFDENARFIGRYSATFSANNYTVTLPQSTNKRILHFIANYDWSAFSDVASLNKDEGELIAPLQSTGLIFWQRIVLNSGIYSGVLTGQPVPLIRNMAKFTLENQAGWGLTNVKFALFNKASAGSVAPFNTATRTFDPVITEPAGVTFTDASTMDVADIYTFERKNSTVTTDPTYVIVQGTYAGATCYYKIDIIDDAKNMYDIQRNVWFKIIIQSVAMAGYSTMEAAKSSPASNNITASVLLQSYPTISDGSYVLSVNKTVISFTSNGQTLNANTTYKTVAGVSQNSSIVVTLVQDPANPLVNGSVSYDPATGNLSAAIHDVPANGIARNATLKIEAGTLSRTIRLLLHAPFTFTNISVTPATVPNTMETPVTLKFTVPAEAEYMLPFNCYVTSAYLTPVSPNIEVVPENGLYRYKWKVTATGGQTINFKTNTANASETVFIDADLFQRGQVAYSNTNGVYRFSNIVLTPNPVDFGTGKAVTLKFTVPTAGVYRIYTSNLTPVTGTVVGGIYTYTATTAGEQIINFTTNKQNVSETIRLTGTNYLDYTIALKNQLVKISGTLTYGTGSGSGSVINAGTVTVSVGTRVVGIFVTTSTGTYQASFDANIGDVLTFSYTRSSRTYTTTQSVTAAIQTITKKLI